MTLVELSKPHDVMGRTCKLHTHGAMGRLKASLRSPVCLSLMSRGPVSESSALTLTLTPGQSSLTSLTFCARLAPFRESPWDLGPNLDSSCSNLSCSRRSPVVARFTSPTCRPVRFCPVQLFHTCSLRGALGYGCFCKALNVQSAVWSSDITGPRISISYVPSLMHLSAGRCLRRSRQVVSH